MATDYGYALEKVNAAVGKLILRGGMGSRLAAAVVELASPSVSLPEGEARAVFEGILRAVAKTPPSEMLEDEAESVARSIWELRARIETERDHPKENDLV